MINGEVRNNANYSSTTSSNEDCISKCQNNVSCIVMEYNSVSGLCRQWEYGVFAIEATVMKTTPETNPNSHDFKTILPNDTCPESLDAINITFVSYFFILVYVPWTKVDGGWTIGICPDGFKRFNRPFRYVCIKAVPMAYGVSKLDAQAMCASMNANLIGVDSEAEATWMWEYVKQTATGDTNRYWMGGERAVTFSKTNFKYEDGITINTAPLMNGSISDLSITESGIVNENSTDFENCLNIRYENGVTTKIDDVACSFTGVSGAFCGF
uniref:C-type lectin domain-containing protein n=2 Tax=Caenorhabditis tropicalis TaxID=1561998 RepID=A0A1I7TBP6_9PELO